MCKTLKRKTRQDGASAEENNGSPEEDVLEKLSRLASPATTVDDHEDSSEPLMTNKTREKAKEDQSEIQDQDSETKKKGSSSSFAARSKRVVYKKTLTWDDVYYCRMTIPLEDARDMFPEPTKNSRGMYNRFYIDVCDEDMELWTIGACFDELNHRYMLVFGWDHFVKKNRLRPNDTIVFTYSPHYDTYNAKFERFAGNDEGRETGEFDEY